MQADKGREALENGELSIRIDKVVYRQCTQEWYMPQDRIAYSNLTLVTGGAADYVLDGRPFRADAGCLIYVPHGGIRQATLVQEDPMRCYSVDFYLTSPEGEKVDLPLPSVTRLADCTVLTDLFSRLNVNGLQKAPYYQLRGKALLQLLISCALTACGEEENGSAGDDERIRAMMAAVGIHYAEDLTLDRFAREFGLNKVYLGMLFKKHTGLSFQRYVLNARLNAAADLLYTGRYAISEAAYMTGFQDPSYFSRMFFEVYGVRPGKYKKMEKPKEPFNRRA